MRAARQIDPQISPLSSTASTIYSLVKYCQWWKTFHDKKCRNIIVKIFCCFRLRGGWLQRAGRAGGRGRGAGLQVLPRAGEQPRHPLLDPLLRRRQAARQRGHRGHALQHRIHVSTAQYSTVQYSTALLEDREQLNTICCTVTFFGSEYFLVRVYSFCSTVLT